MTPASTFMFHRPCPTEDLLSIRLDNQEGSVAVIELAGDLDIDTAQALTEPTESLLSAQAPLVLVLDLAKLQFCGAAGIRALLRVRDKAAEQGTHLILRDPSPITHKVLHLSGLLDVFEFKSSVSDS